MKRKGVITLVTAIMSAAIGYYLSGLTSLLWAILAGIIGTVIGIVFEWGADNMFDYWHKRIAESFDISTPYPSLIKRGDGAYIIEVFFEPKYTSRWRLRPATYDVCLYFGDSAIPSDKIGQNTHKDGGTFDEILPSIPSHKRRIAFSFVLIPQNQLIPEYYRLKGILCYRTWWDGLIEVKVNCSIPVEGKFKEEIRIAFSRGDSAGGI